MIFLPNRYEIVTGTGDSQVSALNAFDQALLAAGIGDVNLVRMSSILPPGALLRHGYTPEYGALVPVAYASNKSGRAGASITAAVAIAIPEDPQYPGLIMEYSSSGTLQGAESFVREMARAGMGFRGREVREVRSAAISHKVVTNGAAFAGVVMWRE